MSDEHLVTPSNEEVMMHDGTTGLKIVNFDTNTSSYNKRNIENFSEGTNKVLGIK